MGSWRYKQVVELLEIAFNQPVPSKIRSSLTNREIEILYVNVHELSLLISLKNIRSKDDMYSSAAKYFLGCKEVRILQILLYFFTKLGDNIIALDVLVTHNSCNLNAWVHTEPDFGTPLLQAITQSANFTNDDDTKEQFFKQVIFLH